MTEKKTVKLSDICILEKGQQIDTSLLDDSKPYRYINGGIKESGYFDNFNTSGESVLISEGGASCGYINYVNEDFWCGCHCYRLHDIKVFPKYLFHALKANQQRIMALRTGSAMPNIQKSTIQKFELKIHDDLKIQQNISSMLDKCNVLIEKHKLILDKYDTLIKSRFIEMFGDPIQNPLGWRTNQLSDYIIFLTSGSRGWSEYFSKDGELFLTIKNVKNSKINIDDVQHVKAPSNKEAERTKVKENDLLISITADLGRTGVISKDIATYGAYINQHLSLVRLDTSKINPLFVSYFLETEGGKIQFLRKNQNAVKAGLNFDAIKSLRIINPPLNRQNDFVSFVQQIDKSKFAVQKSQEKAETLYKSLMQEYFG